MCITMIEWAPCQTFTALISGLGMPRVAQIKCEATCGGPLSCAGGRSAVDRPILSMYMAYRDIHFCLSLSPPVFHTLSCRPLFFISSHLSKFVSFSCSGTPGDEEIDWYETLSFEGGVSEMPDVQHSSRFSDKPDAYEAQQEAVVKPLFRLFKCILRDRLVEVETHVRVFLDYPLRPPRFTVHAVREASALSKLGASSKGGKILEAVNGAIHMEHQANVVGVLATPGSCLNETLLHQLLHLRLAVDDVISQHLAEAPENAVQGIHGGDLASLLHARQQLRGRDRRAPTPCFHAN